jgi:hypothetical protein
MINLSYNFKDQSSKDELLLSIERLRNLNWISDTIDFARASGA